MKQVFTDWVVGTGAALNIETGFVPDLVIVTNATDGTVINMANPSVRTMLFTSGGTNEIKAGHTIIGATSGARARVKKVLTDTGTWAGGDAAGWFIVDADSIIGTFTTENVYYEGSSGINDAASVLPVIQGQDIDTEVATDTGITNYAGVAGSNSKGFTLATAISTDAKLLMVAAFRID